MSWWILLTAVVLSPLWAPFVLEALENPRRRSRGRHAAPGGLLRTYEPRSRRREP